jgi:hypothetical protein
MEVMKLSSHDSGIPSSGRRADLLDLDRLTPEELELWDEMWSGPIGPSLSGPAIEIWSFGYWCMLEPGRVPEVVSERLKELDPAGRLGGQIREYMENLRRARGEGL